VLIGYLSSSAQPSSILLADKQARNCTILLSFSKSVNHHLTSRCPYRAFGRHFSVSFVIGQIMSNHVIHVKSCYSCQIMLFLLNRVFMSNHAVHVKSCHSCQFMPFMSNHVIQETNQVIQVVIHVIHVAIHVIHIIIHVHQMCYRRHFQKSRVGGWGGVSKSAFKAFGRQLCCRPKAKKGKSSTLFRTHSTYGN
jgi:hypothetical protein